ncbi:MAG: NAD(P)-binding domain-containing protein [Thermoanaerobaculia bacterium]
MSTRPIVDLLVVGAGPTGIGLGAEAIRAGLSTLLVDRGALVASLVDYPTEMLFFTTRDRLEIAGVPFTIPDDKPNRRQAVAYYQAVAAKYELPLALHENVESIQPTANGFVVSCRGRFGPVERHARAVAIASGYFCNPLRLGVPGEDLPWVHSRYREPLAHFAEPVVVVGGGNSGVEAALDLFRHGARVTLVHHRPALRETVKYWVKPDIENRIAEGGIRALLGAEVVAFAPGVVRVRTGSGGTGGPAAPDSSGIEELPAGAAYVLIGYAPETGILEAAGVGVDPVTGAPEFDSANCETAVPGLYVAGTIQAGRETHRIFIENSRDHGVRIAAHLADRLRGTTIALDRVDAVDAAPADH